MEHPVVDGSGTEPAATERAVLVPRRKERSWPSRFAVALFVGSIVAVAGVSFAVGRTTAPSIAARGSTGLPAGFPGTPAGGAPNATAAPDASGDPASPAASPGTPGGFPGGQPGDFPGGGFPGGGQGFPGGGAGAGLEGTVVAVADGVITLELGSGETRDIEVDDTTGYYAQQPVDASSVAVGDSVRVEVDPSGLFGGPDASPAPLAATEVTVLDTPAP